MKMIYISPQRLMWVYRKLILWSLLFFVVFFIVTVLKFHYVKYHFPKMLSSSAFFPFSLPFPLISVILYDYTWKKFFRVIIDIFTNHNFHATAPTIKPLIEVLYVWMKAFVVGFISVIPIYWVWIFYWYYTWQNLVG